MTEITLYAGAVALVYLFLAFTAFWGLLRWWDRLTGVNFKRDITPLMLKSPMSIAFYRAALLIAAALIVSTILGCSRADASPFFSDRYDAAIEKSAKRWWPDMPLPNLLKAQLYQESLLDPAAVSPVGARGLAQFMPATWNDMIRQMALPRYASPHDADLAISAAAFYMAKLRKSWSSPRPIGDRHDLALASYNAGLGNILKSQRACGGPALYAEIIACLHLVTGRHATETQTYVVRIHRWFAMLEVSL